MENSHYFPRPAQIVALGIILLIAAALRIHGIGLQCLTNDELGSMAIAAGRGEVDLTLPRGVLLTSPPATTLAGGDSILHVPAGLRQDVHPPLYFLLLRLWQDIFGDGDGVSRALSTAAGLVGIVLIFDLGRLLADADTGLCAAMLMAVAQPQIAYAQDARPYALLAAFMLGAADALVRMERLGPSRRRTASLAVCIAAACLTHYFALPAIAALAIYTALPRCRRARKSAWMAFVSAGLFVLLVWGRGMWIQRTNFSDPWMFWFNEELDHHALAMLWRMSVLPARFLAEPPAATASIALGAGVCYVLPWLRVRRRPGIVLPGISLLACAGFIGGLDLYRGTRQIDWIKYSLLGAAGVYLIIPMLIDRRWLRLVLTALIAISCLPTAFHIDKDAAGSLNQIAARLDQVRGPDDVIILMAPEPGMLGRWVTGNYYLGLERYCRKMPTEVVLMQEPASQQLLDALHGRHCWLIGPTNPGWPEEFMPGWKPQQTMPFPPTAALYKWEEKSDR